MRNVLLSVLAVALLWPQVATAQPVVRIVRGVRHTAPPPPPRDEAVPAAPSERHQWIGGHWALRGKKHVWMKGHWTMPPGAGHIWQPGHWTKEKGEHKYHEGYWGHTKRADRRDVYQPPPPPVDEDVTPQAPPPPLAEERPESPFPGAVWIPGNWHWSGQQHVWVAGRWSAQPAGHRWDADKWAKRKDGKYVHNQGQWRRK
jgi:hypothetical protein